MFGNLRNVILSLQKNEEFGIMKRGGAFRYDVG